MTSIRERLTALRNLAREGAPVDAAELVDLQNKVDAENQIAALAAEGEHARAAEKAERERLARRAQAATDARETVAGSRERIIDAYQALRPILAELDAACADYRESITTATAALTAAGYASWNELVYGPKPVDHPDWDEHMHQIHAHGGAPNVQIDDTRHAPVSAGRVALWAIARTSPDMAAALDAWKRNRDTYPMQAPLGEIAE
ncbi:hypothetical protein [Rhodococcus aetherivorans]|uniref:hypothetical protein n=1 Tax=Rhodococcus aetherivorans TaxID=191292 RepID=UPI0002D23C3B|nr:hypothetical protein [Rhodococcus aetherivorans]CCW12907.1 hypothetical protein EBESD8_34590 [Rhodococcus aetherivorans]